jgi:aspartate kinase
MKILVQKFGGTSVSTKEIRKFAVDKISDAIDKGYSPVVVVSAMGRGGDPYATDTLLSLLGAEFKQIDKAACDLLLSCGETISTAVMCNELWDNNIPSKPLMGFQAGIVTDNNYGAANLTGTDNKLLLKLINEGVVPVVAGFQGISEDGFISTLGRGGSDVTASILGVSLAAEGIEIYTDVDGIMTADPRIVEDASLIDELDYNEVFQFSDQGAKVIHPRAVEIAMRGNIPIIIKNTLNSCPGTRIKNSIKENKKIITGITHMADRVRIKIVKKETGDIYTSIFKILGDNGISIDLINVFPDHTVFTIGNKDTSKFIGLMENLSIKYELTLGCSKIAVIGSGMRGIPGVMARILSSLDRENIEILQTSDSYSTIWCLVNGEDTKKAILSLHKEFNLGA